jgi:hypothetical protein
MLFSILFSLFSAHAFHVEIQGGLNLADPALVGPSTTGTGTGILGGVGLGIDVAPFIDLELGLQYVNRVVDFNGGGGVTNERSTNHFMIPVLFRFDALPIIGIGVGAYYSMATGSVKSTTGSSTSTSTYASSGLKENEFGALGSLDAMFSVAPGSKFGLDARYLLGLTDIRESSTTSEKSRDLQIMLKLQVGI